MLKIFRNDSDFDGDEFAKVVFGGFMVAAIVGLLCIAGVALGASGKPDYCVAKYDKDSDTTEVWAHRPWRSDMLTGRFSTPEAANDAIANGKGGCP